MEKRVTLLDDKSPNFPVQAFFKAIPSFLFVEIVESLLRGVGATIEVAQCRFPGDLDPGEPPFTGVQFALFEEEITINNETFHFFLRMACKAQALRHPEQRALLRNAFTKAGLEPGDI